MFKSSGQNFLSERTERMKDAGKLLRFGVPFLDDALLGITPDDLVLLGAPSGVGKTQLCVNIALANILDGKKVHFIALEAAQFEIERRLKFQFIVDAYYGDKNRPPIHSVLQYDEWLCGLYGSDLDQYEIWAEKFCAAAFKDLFSFYKTDNFDVDDLIQNFLWAASESNLIICDHAHYFDWGDKNDNSAMREIAKAARALVQENKVPLILVAHFRKRDRNSQELVAGLDEFHGSSDLSKIATKAVTIARGALSPDGESIQTFMRTPKNRNNGSATNFIGAIDYHFKKGSYANTYKLGWTNASEWSPVDFDKQPHWFGRTLRRRDGGNRD